MYKRNTISLSPRRYWQHGKVAETDMVGSIPHSDGRRLEPRGGRRLELPLMELAGGDEEHHGGVQRVGGGAGPQGPRGQLQVARRPGQLGATLEQAATFHKLSFSGMIKMAPHAGHIVTIMIK